MLPSPALLDPLAVCRHRGPAEHPDLPAQNLPHLPQNSGQEHRLMRIRRFNTDLLRAAERAGELRELPAGRNATLRCTGTRHYLEAHDLPGVHRDQGPCRCGPQGSPRIGPDLSARSDPKALASGERPRSDGRPGREWQA